jgi:hypothetical protein
MSTAAPLMIALVITARVNATPAGRVLYWAPAAAAFVLGVSR